MALEAFRISHPAYNQTYGRVRSDISDFVLMLDAEPSNFPFRQPGIKNSCFSFGCCRIDEQKVCAQQRFPSPTDQGLPDLYSMQKDRIGNVFQPRYDGMKNS